MKARLVFQINDPARVVHALFHGEMLPEGFEELEPDAEPVFRGTTLVSEETTELCECGHKRSHHVGYQHDCLVLECRVGRLCKRFEEAK